MSICATCNRWFIDALLTLFSQPNVLPQDANSEECEPVKKLHFLGDVHDIYRQRKSCWFCSRIWLMHRFDILGTLEYHSDDDIYAHFLHRQLAITLEYRRSLDSRPDSAPTGTLLLTSETSAFFRVQFTVGFNGDGKISRQRWVQYKISAADTDGEFHESGLVRGPRLVGIPNIASDETVRKEQSPRRAVYSSDPCIKAEPDNECELESLRCTAASSSDRPLLKTKSSAEILEKTRVIIADAIGEDVSAVQKATFLSELGIDSLITVDLANKINRIFGVSISPYMIFNSRDVRRMASAVKYALIWSYKPFERSYTNASAQLDAGLVTSKPLVDTTVQIDATLSDSLCSNASDIARQDAKPVPQDEISAGLGDMFDFAILDSYRTEIVGQWIHACDQHHSCRDMVVATQKNDSVLPTRLVEVLSGPVARLVETTSLSDPHLVRYATLSHCWGGDQSDMLLMSNYASRLKIIVLSHLNNTSSDAIRLCRRLGIRYVWIDSLCIIQDAKSQEDWLHEAPRMDQIYGNSYLNIAATVARSGRENILHEPVTPLSEELEIRISDSICIRSIDQPKQNILRIFRESPLTLRGWVQQELLLSPRTLHLTDEQLIWLCREDLWTEVTRDLTLDTLDGHSRMMLHRSLRADCLDSPMALDNSWRDIVCLHSPTRVTFDKDRYMALSGVARLFQQKYQAFGVGTYLVAGCWHHDLLGQMNWLSKRTLRQPRYHKTYVPTWSWLSVEGKGLIFPETRVNVEFCASLVDVDMQLEHPKLQFGPLTRAAVTLRGPVVFLQTKVFFNWRYSPTTTAAGAQSLTSQMQGDIDTLSNGRGTIISRDALKAGHNNCYFDRVPSKPWGSVFKCILTIANKSVMSSVYQGLILEECASDASGCRQYQRIGSMNIYDVRSALADRDEEKQQTPLQALLAPDSLMVEDVKLV